MRQRERGIGKKLNREEKQYFTEKIVALRTTGLTFCAIAKELDLSPITVRDLWDKYLAATKGNFDGDKVMSDRRAQAESVLLKTIFRFHQGKAHARDVKAAFEAADKYGLDLYLRTLQPSVDMPPILEMDIANVEIELPEVDD